MFKNFMSLLVVKMPTYEYKCEKCKKQFKVFFKTFISDDERVQCPYCQSTDAERLFSSFSFGGNCDSFDSGCGSASGFG